MSPFITPWTSKYRPQDPQRLMGRTLVIAGAAGLTILTGVEIALLNRDVDPASVASHCESLSEAQSRLACYDARDHDREQTSFKTTIPSSLYYTR